MVARAALEECRTALEVMCRTRPVESPPDGSGGRTVWHRAPNGIELVSWLDEGGDILKQELTLIDSTLTWSRAAALEIGAEPRYSIEAIRTVLADYDGTDKLIIHLRGVFAMTAPVGQAGPPVEMPSPPASRIGSIVLIVLSVILLLTAIAVMVRR